MFSKPSAVTLIFSRERAFLSSSTQIYYMAELVHGEKEHSDWFPDSSEFCYSDR